MLPVDLSQNSTAARLSEMLGSTNENDKKRACELVNDLFDSYGDVSVHDDTLIRYPFPRTAKDSKF